MSDTYTSKKVTDLTENTSVSDTDLMLVGNAGTANLRRITFANVAAKIKEKIASWAYDTLNTTNKTLPGAINELNTNITPIEITLAKGEKFSSAAISAFKVGKIIFVSIEGTPSSAITTNDIVASGLPVPKFKNYPVSIGTKDQNYSAVVDENGNIRIWYPGYTTVTRIECTVVYISK